MQTLEPMPRAGGVAASSSDNDGEVDLSEWAEHQLTNPVTTVLTPAIYTLVFIVGFPANALAIWFMAGNIKKPSTICQINLAVADLLLILALPFKIHYHFQGNNWVFGEALCRTATGFFYGNMYCSILLLTFISVDRYCALVHPFYSRRFRGNRFAVSACAVIWVMVGLFVLPLFLVKQSFKISLTNITSCHDVYLENMQNVYFYYWQAVVIIGFIIPALITVVCYSFVIRMLLLNKREYKKAKVVTVLTLLIYLVCFGPSNVIFFLHQWIPDLYIHYMITMPISSFNSCIDPFIYYFISDELRNKVKTMFGIQKVVTRFRNSQTTSTFWLTQMTSTKGSPANSV
ncbi:proteinase-activated receptor 3-like [Amblyraja radiata]|uniref:proteinase-activated receptor 3-like n=1 Tax=Amblyraja radiata TaxID=386614 RepID=UPI001401FCE1|nr:proteinase-activated receptor 3-like [Amblyraja radiata]